MQPIFADLNTAEQEAYRLYKANSPFGEGEFFADHVNQSLRNKSVLSTDWLTRMRTLDALIDGASINDEDRLFRATIDHCVAPFITGECLNYPAYMSTSNTEDAVQRHFSCPFRDLPAALLRISCPKGATGLDMELNAASGGMEREYLLPRGSRFDVDSVEEVTDREMMDQIMSPLYAKNFSSLVIYELRYA